MKKVISIPLHIGDLHAKTFDMNAQEFGAHVRLIIAHYQAGEDGISTDEKKLARIAGVSVQVWRKISTEALKGFHFIPHPDGQKDQARFVNDRCLKEIRWIIHKSEQSSANSLKRKRRGDANAKPM